MISIWRTAKNRIYLLTVYGKNVKRILNIRYRCTAVTAAASYGSAQNAKPARSISPSDAKSGLAPPVGAGQVVVSVISRGLTATLAQWLHEFPRRPTMTKENVIVAALRLEFTGSLPPSE